MSETTVLEAIRSEARLITISLGNGLALLLVFPFLTVGWVVGLIVGLIKLCAGAVVVGFRRGIGIVTHAKPTG